MVRVSYVSVYRPAHTVNRSSTHGHCHEVSPLDAFQVAYTHSCRKNLEDLGYPAPRTISKLEDKVFSFISFHLDLLIEPPRFSFSEQSFNARYIIRLDYIMTDYPVMILTHHLEYRLQRGKEVDLNNDSCLV